MPDLFVFLKLGMPGFLKLFSEKCACVCMYICLSFCTYMSKPFTWSLKPARIQTIKAKQSSHTGKLCLNGVFLSQSNTDFYAGFPGQLFRRSTTEKQRTRPHGHPRNAYLVVLKVGVTHIYVNENEEQP